MRDFPSCFGESGVQVGDASCSSVIVSKPSQNSVTCMYRCKLLEKYCLISIVWSKSLIGQCLSVEINDASHQFTCKVDVKPSLFSKRKGSRSLELKSCKIEVFWDLSLAKFGSGPEPLELYYVGVVCKGEMVLLIGDLIEVAFKKTGAIAAISNAMLITKRECILGKRVFSTKARLCDKGPVHDLKIECDTKCIDDPFLVVSVDARTVMRVHHLRWKFRGNCTIVVDGAPVEVFWDVHSWLFGLGVGSGVFMFQTSLSSDMLSIWRCSESLKEPKVSSLGYALVIYGWKNE